MTNSPQDAAVEWYYDYSHNRAVQVSANGYVDAMMNLRETLVVLNAERTARIKAEGLAALATEIEPWLRRQNRFEKTTVVHIEAGPLAFADWLKRYDALTTEPEGSQPCPHCITSWGGEVRNPDCPVHGFQALPEGSQEEVADAD